MPVNAHGRCRPEAEAAKAGPGAPPLKHALHPSPAAAKEASRSRGARARGRAVARSSATPLFLGLWAP